MVEQLSTFINSRSIFIKTDGSAVLKLHRSHLDRSLLFIFPDHRSEQGYFQDTVHISLQAVSNAGANTLSRTGTSTCAWLPAAEADVVSPKRSQAPALYSESSVSQRQTEAQLLARLPQIPAQTEAHQGFLNLMIFVATTRGGRYHCSWIFCLAAGPGDPRVAAGVCPPAALPVEAEDASAPPPALQQKGDPPWSNSPLLLRPPGCLIQGETSNRESQRQRQHLMSSRV